LNDLLKSLEDSGEVNLQIAEHKLEKDGAGNFKVKPLGGVCFILDPLKPNPRRKRLRWVPEILGFSQFLFHTSW